MFQEAFKKLSLKKCEKVLQEVTPLLSGTVFNPETATVLTQPLSFYPGYDLLDISDYQIMPHVRKFAVYKQGDAAILDWTNAPVYALNERAPLFLSEKTAGDYARFFFGFVRGSQGRFFIVENPDDINWRDEPPPSVRRELGHLLSPLDVRPAESGNGFDIRACLMFKGTLYKASIHIASTGHVTISGQELLMEGFPVFDDVLGQ